MAAATKDRKRKRGKKGKWWRGGRRKEEDGDCDDGDDKNVGDQRSVDEGDRDVMRSGRRKHGRRCCEVAEHQSMSTTGTETKLA